MRIDQAISGKRDRIEMELASLVAPTRNGDTIAESTAKAARRMVQRVNPQEIASLMASMASVHRIVILHRLLQGSAGYKELQTASKLKAGPLYHHVASLRLAGLIGPKARDTYELTELGVRLAVLTAMLPKLVRAKRKQSRQACGKNSRSNVR